MNNRIIKFRAWFDGPKLMGDVITLRGSNRTDYDANMWDEVTAECRIKGRQQFYSSSNFKLLQSTGLRDKNGKEIYEGDIINCIHPLTKKMTLYGTVTFANGCFKFDHINDPWNLFTASEIEVIGNLYEHPHLLNQDK